MRVMKLHFTATLMTILWALQCQPEVLHEAISERLEICRIHFCQRMDGDNVCMLINEHSIYDSLGATPGKF